MKFLTCLFTTFIFTIGLKAQEGQIPQSQTPDTLKTLTKEKSKYKFFGWQIKFESYLKKEETISQTKSFAHLAKDFNLYYEAESLDGSAPSTTEKSSDKVPF